VRSPRLQGIQLDDQFLKTRLLRNDYEGLSICEFKPPDILAFVLVAPPPAAKAEPCHVTVMALST
jgi:hypothetical protein